MDCDVFRLKVMIQIVIPDSPAEVDMQVEI